MSIYGEKHGMLTNKAVIADFSANTTVLIQTVLCANTEFGCIRS